MTEVIASAVIRSTFQGESHGGLYIVDLNSDTYEQVLDWNDNDIDWSGRGGDRRLRGIAFHKDQIYLAASDQIFIYDKKFRLLDSYRNRYLKYCHEIHISNNTLFITSTGFDSLLELDIPSKSFEKGYCLRRGDSGRCFDVFRQKLRSLFRVKLRRYRAKDSPFSNLIPAHLEPKFWNDQSLLLRAIDLLYEKIARVHGTWDPGLRVQVFDPNSEEGPSPGDTIHVNNVSYLDDKLFVSGLYFDFLLCIENEKTSAFAKLPYGSHNAIPYNGNVLLNDTANSRVAVIDRYGKLIESFRIKRYKEEELVMSNIRNDHARQGFGRGLCMSDDGFLIGGSSPATISVYSHGHPAAKKAINISMDVRNSIHGLEIWRD
jgi:hypothetical protein